MADKGLCVPRMFCLSEYSHCKGEIIASHKGCNPITVFKYFRNKPNTISKAVSVNDDFYKYLLKSKDNPTDVEYDSIVTLIKFLFNRFPENKKHLSLKAASIYYATCGVNLELEEGIVMDQTGDYINFHDHTNESISYRRKMIQ